MLYFKDERGNLNKLGKIEEFTITKEPDLNIFFNIKNKYESKLMAECSIKLKFNKRQKSINHQMQHSKNIRIKKKNIKRYFEQFGLNIQV